MGYNKENMHFDTKFELNELNVDVPTQFGADGLHPCFISVYHLRRQHVSLTATGPSCSLKERIILFAG